MTIPEIAKYFYVVDEDSKEGDEADKMASISCHVKKLRQLDSRLCD